MILALDLGTTTGWAFGQGGTFLSGVWDLKGGRYDGGGMRYLRFRGFLEKVHAEAPITRIAYEEVRRHAGTDAAHVYGGLQAVLTAWAEEHGVPYEGVPVGTIKKFWCQNGRAPKEAMVAECHRREIAVKDHNEADAVALLHVVMADAASAGESAAA